jgi:parvulin-like peptidyl-prolyl isomerase
VNKTLPTRPPAGRPARTPAVSATVRRRASRAEREQRLRLLILGGLGIALLAVLVVPLIGYYREVLTKGSQRVAYAKGDTVTLETFTKMYGYKLITLDAQLNQMRQFVASNPQLSQQVQQLESQRTSLDSTVLDELVEQRLVAQEAARRGITIAPADEDARIERDFGSSEAPTPTAPADATPGPAPTAIPTVAATERFKNALSNIKVINEDDYRQLVVRPTLLSERLQDTFTSQVPPTELQIHARHILLETEDAAKAAKERIAKGEPFDKVATELTKDSATKDKGGDLGWFGKGKMTQPFEEAAFQAPLNEVSEPVRSAFGWHVIQVLERDENHPLDEPGKTERRNKLFSDWLEQQKDDGFKDNSIGYEWGSDKFTWAKQQVNKARGLPKNAD